MIEPQNPVLSKMLDRLFASMVSGPSMNCRPQSSRQRVDWTQLAKFQDLAPGAALASLLGEARAAKLSARAPMFGRNVKQRGGTAAGAESDGKEINAKAEAEEMTPEERAAKAAWSEQQSLLTKLRVVADDARTYEQDTGVYALNIGFPLLSLPPGSFSGRAGLGARRVLAPIAFIPVTLTVKTGAKQTVELSCRAGGADRVVPNHTLLAWLEQQTGQPLGEAFADEAGAEPWREVAELVRTVAQRVEVAAPEPFSSDEFPNPLALQATPKADEDTAGPAILASAVLGLFPAANQGLLRDTREMLAQGADDGPVASFLRHGVSLDVQSAPAEDAAPSLTPSSAAGAGHSVAPRVFAQERLVSESDPCQTRAVRLAGKARGLVVHGPPGTGKSQTIANIIGDHLARGERVLFVCEKRTALDVVGDRLRGLGLGDLCATVHDPQRDQRELYRAVREQLDNLADTPLQLHADDKLAAADAELQALHGDLSQYYRRLMGRNGEPAAPGTGYGGPGSFHHLVGQWLSETGDAAVALDERSLQGVATGEWERHAGRLKEALQRGDAAAYAENPWRSAAGIELARFLAEPMDACRALLGACLESAEAADATADANLPAFEEGEADDLRAEARRRRQIAQALGKLEGLPTASASYWMKQPASAVASAGAEAADAAPWVAEARSRPLDPALRQETSAVAPVESLAADRKTLADYATAFEDRSATFARLTAAAPGAEPATVLRWMSAEPKAAAAARKRLEGAAPLAAEVAATTLDASLLARHEAAPLTPARLVEFLAALDTYLPVVGKWHAFLQFSKKKAAGPAVRQFGLALNAANAGRVHQFLLRLQQRTDLRAAVESAAGPRWETAPDDAELLDAFRQHLGVLSAMAMPRAANQTLAEPGPDHAAADPAVVGHLNGLIGPPATAAQAVLERYALGTESAPARRLEAFLGGLEARVRLASLLDRLAPGTLVSAKTPDEQLLRLFDLHARLLDLLTRAPVATPVGRAVAQALTDPLRRQAIVDALDHADRRVEALLRVARVLSNTKLFSSDFLKSADAELRAGGHFAGVAAALGDRLDTLEGVLRIRDALAEFPPPLAAAATSLLHAATPAAQGFSALRRIVLAGGITRRLAAWRELQNLDGRRLANGFDRFRHLADAKRLLVREQIQHRWVTRQKERLLVGAHTRLNAMGADLRRRLTIRGERAMRLRQVIAHGSTVAGGDPLFDLRPVWMASPETVAQLFPRQPVFDVVVFDEASQCRLEEALPVLTRARRVVIAGDRMQLPPTRFFESAVVASESIDADSDQELFESQQGEVEDLLTAALGLDIHQSYLDVHYRSRNADLIGFSNEHFYGSRLQAIPEHPRNRTRYAPITLYRVDGVYEKRKNPAEADQVCQIVRDLLKRAAPPSIGIACFNLTQRDLIVEKLEELAEADAEFGARLAGARERRGGGFSEGLFVKNLENVQGDERDHLIVSTTYGPDASGKFRRQFGPLGAAGGGRRLNVLVTRARDELHLVTSIPRSAYGALAPVPQGAAPGGAWLLFAYLQYAEQLQQEYDLNHRVLEDAGRHTAPQDGGARPPEVNVRASRCPSAFSAALALRLAAVSHIGSDVPWGNEGFCIDVALHHPRRPEDVTVGVLCDMNRYAASDDPVEWEVFRTAIHEAQGWKLKRVWSPHFFRDPAGAIQAIEADVRQALAAEGDIGNGASGAGSP